MAIPKTTSDQKQIAHYQCFSRQAHTLQRQRVGCREWFDLIFLDPPSFSNSKRMAGALDIQQDHITLIDSAMRLLLPGGQLYFSTNLRHFFCRPSYTSVIRWRT